MENSNKFFRNTECRYFPCHARPERAEFNCLFCFCPLYYPLGDECGGNFSYNDKGRKNCVDCHLPHTPEYFDVIVSKLKAIPYPLPP